MENQLPIIHVLGTGGTISYNPQTSAEAISLSAKRLEISDLLSDLPELRSVADIRSEQLFMIGSSSITDAHWLKLAARINKLLAGDGVDGVVVTHGTDTMEETAYFLNLTVKSDKPVVLTGAMRTASARAADGLPNLIDAIRVCADKKSRGMGVLLVMDEQILAARDASKHSSFRVGAFGGAEYGCLGKVAGGAVSYAYAPRRPHTAKSEFDVAGLETLPAVDILYGYAESGARQLLALAGLGAQGIVYAALGNGFMNPEIQKLYRENKENLPILVRSTRVPTGGVQLNYQMDDYLYGSAAAGDLSPQKARILLKLALTKTTDIECIRQMYATY